MTEIAATPPIGIALTPDVDATPCQAAPTSLDFSDVLARGAADLEARIDRADALVRAFAIDDSIPLHEVTIALEEARIAVELAVQLRTRLVETYRDIMNMQL